MLGKFCVFVQKNLMMLVGIAILVSVVGLFMVNSNDSTTIAYMNALLNNITIIA